MLRVGANASLQADDTITVNQPIDGRGLRAGGGLDLTAGNSIAINNDMLTDNGAVTLTAGDGGITMGTGPADSITGGTGTVIATGSGNITMNAGGDIGVQHLVTSGDIDLSSRICKVTLNQDLGGVFGGNPQIGGLSVDAATQALIDGQIIAGGPVTLSAPNVTLKHSIFTDDQDIVLGQSCESCVVELDPGEDQLAKDLVGFDARSDRALAKGNQVVEANDTDGTGLTNHLTVDAKFTSRQITLDTGTGGGNIEFKGEVDILEKLRNIGTGVGDDQGAVFVSGDPNGQPGPAVLPVDYVTLRLSAGTGTVMFRQGIAKKRGATIGVKIPGPGETYENPGFSSTNTVDVVLDSGAAIDFGPESFVNSFTNEAMAHISGTRTLIFHELIGVEDVDNFDEFLKKPEDRNVELIFQRPPIWPEPQLPGRFGPGLGGGALGIAQALAIASAVEETQREDKTACGEHATGEGGEAQGEGDSCAPTVEAEGEDLYAIESGPKEAEPARVD